MIIAALANINLLWNERKLRLKKKQTQTHNKQLRLILQQNMEEVHMFPSPKKKKIYKNFH